MWKNIEILFLILIFFVPVLVIFSFFDYLTYRHWTLFYVALGDESYLKVTGRLRQEGIKYRTKTLFNQNVTPMGRDRPRYYEIYIKSIDEDKVTNIISTLKKF